ncbi:DUF4157 domain-containing protein [Acidiferrimicrobium sp. IK]|uniref:eCIS core domain-containing protein n=1 Tax=Acidiferrimicrobium sp. IK TaxID=2871700 RepID=UPI0021CAF4D9|nr:DUF4157 domain-containing protein [Acidiferrimicrobium sp. IK]MCU4186599.1 DUF4157 domain-containing protein [Acidiferrimicrobium sp. IK]
MGKVRQVQVAPERIDQRDPESDVAGLPAAGAGAGIESLQHTAGNRAVTDLLRVGQARLRVGAADDPYEHEADAVARRVVQALRSAAPATVGPETDDPGAPGAGQAPLRRLMRRAPIGADGGDLDPGTEAALSSARGGGQPLPAAVRASMEGAFGGADFGNVRLHSGPGAAALNRAVSAEAFTVGSDIFFSGAVPDAANPAGQELLAHELTHTVQQGASPTVQRWSPFKKKDKPAVPSITPEQAQELINKIQASPEMTQADRLRDQGKEDQALDAVETYWDKGKVTLGDGTEIVLKDFKPLLFTPAERRMVKVKKWRLASAVRGLFDESVRKGQTAIPVVAGAPSQAAKEALAPHQKAKGPTDGGGVAAGFGGVGTTSSLAGLGSKVGQHFADPSNPNAKNMSLAAKELDTSYMQKGDPLNTAPSMQSKSDWANGTLSVITDSFSFLSQVVVIIKQITDDKSSKADVAESTAGALATLTNTASDILQVIEKAQGSELTTNMFHWVPGLSIFSNAFMAMKSAISLVPKAVGLHGIRTHGNKVTEKEREDLKLAVERLWVRSSQQVEADSFATAKSLTNAGLAIAEVASGGGFGIPRLASAVVTGAGVVHTLGHTIADSLRAAATKTARIRYFGAHEAGSAEKLIRTDPQAAAEAIMTRAMEGDPQAIGVLRGFDIKLPLITATQQPGTSRTVVKPAVPVRAKGRGGANDPGNAGRAAQVEDTLDYDHAATTDFDQAMVKLMSFLAESTNPKTIGDKIKDTFKKLKDTPGDIRARYRDAKRIAQARNEANYKNKGKDRGTTWAVTTALFGSDSDVAKLAENTERDLRATHMDQPTKTKLLELLTPEAIRDADKQRSKLDATRAYMDISAPLDKAAKAQAEKLSVGKLSEVVHQGKKASGLNDRQWEAYLAVFTTRLNEKAATAVAPPSS